MTIFFCYVSILCWCVPEIKTYPFETHSLKVKGQDLLSFKGSVMEIPLVSLHSVSSLGQQ